MKTSTFYLLVLSSTFIFCSGILFGQNNAPWHVRRAYVNMGGGNNLSYVQFNTQFNNGWVAIAGFDEGNPESRNLPSDYIPGITYILGIKIPDTQQKKDNYNTFSFGMGKVLTKPSDKAWLMATAGLAFGKYEEKFFTRQAVTSGTLILISGSSSNYSIRKESSSMVGLRTGLQGHINLARVIGLSGGLHGMISNQGFFPYYTFGLNLGLMRPSREKMITKE